MIVIDCSALVTYFTDAGETGEQLRARLAGEDLLAAPYLLEVEFSSALFSMGKGKQPKLTTGEIDRHLKHYAQLRIEYHPAQPLWPRVRKLINNLSAYDATYVALAEVLSVPLVTTDVRIAKGLGQQAKTIIETFPQPTT
ncbi:type II toxin-antitoxin system VapC family toxin [Streptomyces sp. CS014]|uniref:type II toxin-antitoxin system VapC family toxin n=1 Tax=Streptomyces sp. CS014 TaxID=2162707 RepID=UPI000D517D39|nr:type II toxin-antitoxin system VapC family toxin [Streptomyces sp. CS014]PVD04504.1 VapC toxin family PIN domain ribonuclease [Streptomyces sp. CS014]